MRIKNKHLTAFMLNSVVVATLLIVFCAFFPSVLAAQTFEKSAAVAGFINLGSQSDKNINLTLTKSLISFLSRVPGVYVVPYEQMEKMAKQYGIWNKPGYLSEDFIGLGQRFHVKLVVSGIYRVDYTKKTIVIQVYIHDVVTGELLLKRNYEGPSDLGLFDTIDNMVKSVVSSIAGKEINFSTLYLSVFNTEETYFVSINGRDITNISAGIPFIYRLLSGEDTEILLKLGQGREVYREKIKPAADQMVRIDYEPAGNILVKTLTEGGEVIMDGRLTNVLQREGQVIFNKLKANRITKFSRWLDGFLQEEKEIATQEGETLLLLFDGKSHFESLINYSRSNPVMNLLLPGYTEFQAHDYLPGCLFSGTAVLSVCFTALSAAGYYSTQDRYHSSVTDEEKDRYLGHMNTWQTLLIVSASVYAANDLLSFIHASLNKDAGDIIRRQASFDSHNRFSFTCSYQF